MCEIGRRGHNGQVKFTIRRPQLPVLFASLGIAVCLVAIGLAVSLAVTGDERLDLPTAIEKIDPVRGAPQVPSQTQVFVDLQAGYEGVLVIDGLELVTVNLEDLTVQPGRELELPPTTIYERGNATLTFDPSPQSEISEFSEGEHLVKVIYWKVTDGRSQARSFTWSFTVF